MRSQHYPGIVDLHADLPADVIKFRKSFRESKVLERRHLAKLRKGSVVAAITPIWVEGSYKPDHALKRGLLIADAFFEDLNESENFRVTTGYSTFQETVDEGKIALILGCEGGELIESNIELLRDFWRLGLRVFGFVWNQRNLIADGWDHRDDDRGLSSFGKEVVMELESRRILIDLCHIAPKSFWDTIKLAQKPLIVSHAATSRYSSLRSLTDEQLKAISHNGGVVGIFAVNYGDTHNLQHYCDHIEHACKTAGIEHVALGPDFYDYLLEEIKRDSRTVLDTMEGLEDHSKLTAVLQELSRRGFSEDEIEMIANKNFLRVFRQVVG